MSDEVFCSPEEAQQVQAEARRELFPNAPAKVVCKLCNNMMPNPVIEYGVFTGWCVPCVRSKFSQRTLHRMTKTKVSVPVLESTGALTPRPISERMESKSTENDPYDRKPHLTLSSYLIHG